LSDDNFDLGLLTCDELLRWIEGRDIEAQGKQVQKKGELSCYICATYTNYLSIVFADIIQAIMMVHKSEQPSKGDIEEIIAEVSLLPYLIISLIRDSGI
jgi:hypothetical protein